MDGTAKKTRCSEIGKEKRFDAQLYFRKRGNLIRGRARGPRPKEEEKDKGIQHAEKSAGGASDLEEKRERQRVKKNHLLILE